MVGQVSLKWVVFLWSMHNFKNLDRIIYTFVLINILPIL